MSADLLADVKSPEDSRFRLEHASAANGMNLALLNASLPAQDQPQCGLRINERKHNLIS
jgi:hypothetical protein